MANFAVTADKHYETKIQVYKLVKEGNCLVDEFVREIKKDANIRPELGELFSIIRYVANCNFPFPPKTRYRKLNLSSKLKYIGYEAKTNHLRLYTFHEKGTGQILVFGGKKTSQGEDLKYFEKLIKEYAEFQQKNK